MGDRTGDDIYISPKYKIERWKALNLDTENPNENDWNTAVDVLDDRITERFLKPAKCLIDAQPQGAEQTYGFAILALNFIVIETVQGFRKGLVSHRGHLVSQDLFAEFCINWSAFRHSVADDTESNARLLFASGRCALHHSGTTDNLTVSVTGSMVTFNQDQTIRVNRTEFYFQLVEEFKHYLLQLRDPASIELRRNFKTKMNSICGVTD